MGVGGVGWTAHQFSLGSIHVFGVYVYWRSICIYSFIPGMFFRFSPFSGRWSHAPKEQTIDALNTRWVVLKLWLVGFIIIII